MEEDALIRRSKCGDHAAFGELVAAYQLPVFRVVRGVLGDPEESEDVSQEVFLKAFRNLERFRGDSTFFTWLYRIALNESIRVLRRRPTPRAGPLSQVEAPQPDADATELPSLALLERLLRLLPQDQRTIVVLRDIERLSYREVAEALEIPLGTVESRLFRARQELRNLWKRSREAQDAL